MRNTHMLRVNLNFQNLIFLFAIFIIWLDHKYFDIYSFKKLKNLFN